MTRNAAPRARRSRLVAGEPLPRSFYDRETEIVARELLGQILVHETPEGITSGRIVETEAYLGEHDPACHAAVGITARTKWLYGAPGTAYVYFIYGVHWCFNAVTRAEGSASAVLVRALEPLEGIPLMRMRRSRARSDRDLASGPGKLCQALGVSGTHNGWDLTQSPLRVVAGVAVPSARVLIGPRIGISKAVDLHLRWHIKGNTFVSGSPNLAG
jgi:DNA-3-methyladenine glycosylase